MTRPLPQNARPRAGVCAPIAPSAGRNTKMAPWDECPLCRSTAREWGVKATPAVRFPIARCSGCGFA